MWNWKINTSHWDDPSLQRGEGPLRVTVVASDCCGLVFLFLFSFSFSCLVFFNSTVHEWDSGILVLGRKCWYSRKPGTRQCESAWMSVSQKAVLTPRPFSQASIHLCPTVTSQLGLTAPTLSSRLWHGDTADVNQKSTNTDLTSLKGVCWQKKVKM